MPAVDRVCHSLVLPARAVLWFISFKAGPDAGHYSGSILCGVPDTGKVHFSLDEIEVFGFSLR